MLCSTIPYCYYVLPGGCDYYAVDIETGRRIGRGRRPLAKRSWKSCSSSPKLPQLSSKQQKHWLLEIACIYHNDLRTPFGVLTLFLVEEGSKVSNLSLGKLLGVEKIQGQGFKKQTCTCRGDAFLRINTTKSPEPSTFPGERKAQNQPSELIRQRW